MGCGKTSLAAHSCCVNSPWAAEYAVDSGLVYCGSPKMGKPEAHAVQPQLMRAARQGVQFQKRRFFRPLQHAVLRQRPLPPLVHDAG